MKKAAAFALTAVLMIATPSIAHAKSYKHKAPSVTSVSVVSCSQVKVTWKRTGDFTTVNYSRSSSFGSGEHLSWFPREYGAKEAVRRATTTTVSHLRPGKTYHFRVFASTYAGVRESKYSSAKSITLPTC